MHKYSLPELYRMSIFDVRTLAKTVGVPAPTKINKSELVDLIYKISNGLMEPPTAPHRGRPPKTGALAVDASDAANDSASSDSSDCAVSVSIEENAHTPVQPEKAYTPARGLADEPIRRSRDYDSQGENTDAILMLREGSLEISADGYGFLRVKEGECNEMDAYVPTTKIRSLGLRRGDYVVANCRKMHEDKPAAVIDVISVNGVDPSVNKSRPNFDTLTPVYPNSRLRLEVPNQPRAYAMRCIDLVSPIGRGQRGIIVSPPKAGKTTLLKMIAGSITKNYPDVILKVLLIDERPEEVTDMQRSIKGEVIYSTFDEAPEHHTKTAEMVLEKCKRIVETGKDVVILLDSLTRLARAYNLTVAPTGRTLSGGLDPGALFSPKRFFGSARNLEPNDSTGYKGGSLTIIATALIETGSRMDDVIFEEFKGTGNMEIHLDRKLSEKRIFPAIDLAKSSTRKEELLLAPDELEAVWGMRKILSNTDNADATENLINMIVKTSSNKEFIDQLNSQLRLGQKNGFTVRSVK